MSLKGRLGGRRRRDEGLRQRLSQGGAVQVSCQLRRTSSRGWGAWTEGVVDLGPFPDGEARWSTDDPVAVGFPSTSGAVDLAFHGVTDVYLRPIRFRTEAFWGMDGDIIVVAAEPTTMELALPSTEIEAVARRLIDLLGLAERS